MRASTKQHQPREFLAHRALANAALFAVASGCSTFEGLVHDPDASSGGVGGSESSCRSAQPPRAAGLAGTGSGPDIWLASRSVDFGDRYEDGGAPDADATTLHRRMGFDLDRTCTGQGDAPSCVAPSWAIADHSDGPGGRDNAIGAFLHQIAQGQASRDVTLEAESGEAAAIIRIRGYNHTGADNEVEVAWYAGRVRSAEGTRKHTSVADPPGWEGEDEWIIFDRWLEPLPARDAGPPDDEHAPIYYDARAYVTGDNILVAHFREVNLVNGLFEHVVISGQLVQTSGFWELRDVTFAGRIRAKEVLAGIPLIDLGDLQLCTTVPGYDALKRIACSYADIHASPPGDGSEPDDPSLPCDSLSAGWTFHAVQVRVVGKRGWDEYWVPPCPQDALTAPDSCDTLD